MILPLVLIDLHEKVSQNPDYTVSMDDIRSWEMRNGLIPERSFVALRTDWSKRWPDQDAMENSDPDGVTHYPGWSQEVLTYLYEERNITASGDETTDTDSGGSSKPGEVSAGALIVVTFPKPLDGSGFPARVLTICPEEGEDQLLK